MWLRFYIIQKLENLSSIVFYTAILNMLSKEAKSRNVASFLYSGKNEVSMIDSIPHFHTGNALKRGKHQEMWLRYNTEDKVGVSIIESIPHCHDTVNAFKRGKKNVALFLYR